MYYYCVLIMVIQASSLVPHILELEHDTLFRSREIIPPNYFNCSRLWDTLRGQRVRGENPRDT